MIRFGALVERIDKRLPGSGLPLLSVSQTRGVLRRSEISDAPPRADSLDHYKVCLRDDIVFNKMSIRSGAMGLAREDGLVTYHYEVMRSRDAVSPEYVVYLMKSQFFTGELIKRERGIGAGDTAGGVRTTEVPFKILKTIQVPRRTLQTQLEIVAFLDRETAQVDAFIAKNEELISLLVERHSSAVKSAVLGVDVPGRRILRSDPWVGDIPATWQSSRLSRWFKITLGKMLDESKFDESTGEVLPYIRAANIGDRSLDLSDLKSMPFTSSERVKFSLRAGDLLVVEGGSIGFNSHLSHDLPDTGFQKTVNRVRSLGEASTAYLGYVLDAMRRDGVLAMHANASTIAHLTAEKLERLVIPQPDLTSQELIVRRLDLATEKTFAAVATAQRAIELAKERRAALISAAVTGKIDVRSAA